MLVIFSVVLIVFIFKLFDIISCELLFKIEINNVILEFFKDSFCNNFLVFLGKLL